MIHSFQDREIKLSVLFCDCNGPLNKIFLFTGIFFSAGLTDSVCADLNVFRICVGAAGMTRVLRYMAPLAGSLNY